MLKLHQKVKRGIVLWLARRLPTCRDTTRLVSDSMDRRLSLRWRVEMKLHLLICVWCERYARQLIFLRDAVRHEPPPATALSPEARERIKRSFSNINDNGLCP